VNPATLNALVGVSTAVMPHQAVVALGITSVWVERGAYSGYWPHSKQGELYFQLDKPAEQ
jgi:hypothetical protein